MPSGRRNDDQTAVDDGGRLAFALVICVKNSWVKEKLWYIACELFERTTWFYHVRTTLVQELSGKVNQARTFTGLHLELSFWHYLRLNTHGRVAKLPGVCCGVRWTSLTCTKFAFSAMSFQLVQPTVSQHSCLDNGIAWPWSVRCHLISLPFIPLKSNTPPS